MIDTKMAAGLRQLHNDFYSSKGTEQFYLGICYALQMHRHNSDTSGSYRDAYRDMDELLLLCEEGWQNGGELPGLRYRSGDWGQRAMMCLFMAEFIETDVLGMSFDA